MSIRNQSKLRSVEKKRQTSQSLRSYEAKRSEKDAILKELNSHVLSVKTHKIHQRDNKANVIPATGTEDEIPSKSIPYGRKIIHIVQGNRFSLHFIYVPFVSSKNDTEDQLHQSFLSIKRKLTENITTTVPTIMGTSCNLNNIVK